jgi:predicted DsbA family dithiol-disulfide isomerase
VRIEIWSDVVCPWCYIGKRRFEAAAATLDEPVEVVWRSFELDPGAPHDSPGRTTEHLADKYGMTLEEAQTAQDRVSSMAAEEGLEYHLDRTRRTNSFDAHRVSHLARERGLQDAWTERVFRAYFTEGEHVGEHDTLARLGAEIGLDENEVREVLTTERFAEAVREDERRAQLLGINGVPFFVVEEKYGVSGAQPAAVFEQVFQEVAA